jgi:hypothetical protein
VGRSFLGDPKVRWRIRYGDRRGIVSQGSKYGRVGGLRERRGEVQELKMREDDSYGKLGMEGQGRAGGITG